MIMNSCKILDFRVINAYSDVILAVSGYILPRYLFGALFPFNSWVFR